MLALQGGAPSGWTSNPGGLNSDVLSQDFGTRHCSIRLTGLESASSVATFSKLFN